MLQAAARIADGQVPYRDFWWFYPPGQPVLLGGLWAAARPVAAVVEARARAGVRRGRGARLAAGAARRRAAAGGARPRGWRRRSRWPIPSGPHPFPVTLALCLGALLCSSGRRSRAR